MISSSRGALFSISTGYMRAILALSPFPAHSLLRCCDAILLLLPSLLLLLLLLDSFPDTAEDTAVVQEMNFGVVHTVHGICYFRASISH